MVKRFTSLYVHVPFCSEKCGYCAFYSVPEAEPDARAAYLRRLEQELAESESACAELSSVYVGGGTPSVLTPDELDALLRTVREHGVLAEGAEFTVECNPDSLTPEKAELLARHGVNRVSLGIQSFQRRLREVIGRHGSLGPLEEALGALRGHGIANLGMDLIYAIPGQTLQDWQSDVRQACASGIRHLSTYELTAEEGTRLAEGRAAPVAEEAAVAMWEATAEVAGDAGMGRYEVSNLAQPGCECRHNDDVWHGGTYLGVGPAACSYDGVARATNPRDLQLWLDGAPAQRDFLAPAARAKEVLAFGLRTVRGWSSTEFRERTGFDYLALRGPALVDLVVEGMLRMTDECLRPTDRGLLFADHVARRLL